jgi:hypothetical protein
MLAVPPPVVPVSVQQAIVRRAPALAYVPARVGFGYRYRHWSFAGSAVRIWFANRAGKEIVFVAARRAGPCANGSEKTFQMAGNKVYWGHRAEEQEAWRCLNGVQLVAATPQPPTAFADVGLGRVVASAHRIR